MRHATPFRFAVAAASLTLVTLALPGLAKPNAAKAPAKPAIHWMPAHLGSDGAAATFVMNKWLDAKGTQKAAVKGGFTDVIVSLNKPVAQLKTLADLKGLKGQVTVNLASVETGNPARNLNLSNTYFETGKYAKATVSFDQFRTLSTPANRLGLEKEADLTADAVIDLHGITRTVKDTQWHVAKVADGILVTTLAPLSLASADYSLPAAALMKVCQHLGLDPAAAVSVSVLLQP
jgi:polyisoprenoid-binding protein YceI